MVPDTGARTPCVEPRAAYLTLSERRHATMSIPRWEGHELNRSPLRRPARRLTDPGWPGGNR